LGRLAKGWIVERAPTLRTIAETAGLAVTTVSRALAGDDKIAESTRLRVAEIAASVGYVPDRAARRLRTGRTNMIALVLSPHEEILGFRGSMIAGISQAITGTDFHISMAPYDGAGDPMTPVSHIVRNRLADGIVFSGTSPDDPRAAFLTDVGFPFVSHGRTMWPTPHAWCDYDNDEFARLAVDRLCTLGRKRLLLIPPSRDRTYATHMIGGFLAACAALGVKGVIPATVSLASSPTVIQQTALQLWHDDGIDGFVCPGEVAAMAVLAGLQDHNARIGSDVDVIAKQTSQTFDLYRPRVDTIYEDIRATGEVLGGLLLRRIAGEPADGLQILLPPTPHFRTVR
jgi:LacI family transcriptional regulator